MDDLLDGLRAIAKEALKPDIDAGITLAKGLIEAHQKEAKDQDIFNLVCYINAVLVEKGTPPKVTFDPNILRIVVALAWATKHAAELETTTVVKE